MKCLTLTQPWATLVAIGAKKFETRSWRTAYRGPIAIHSAKSFPKKCQSLCSQEPFRCVLHGAGYDYPWNFPCGYVLAVAELTDCFRVTEKLPEFLGKECHFVYFNGKVATTKIVDRMQFFFGDFSKDRYIWELSNVQGVNPIIPCKGSLGLWTVPDNIVRMLPGGP
jgi:hypothetical protein